MVDAGRRAFRLTLVGTLVSALGQGLTLPYLFIYLHDVLGAPLAVAGVVLAVASVIGLGATLSRRRSTAGGSGASWSVGLIEELVQGRCSSSSIGRHLRPRPHRQGALLGATVGRQVSPRSSPRGTPFNAGLGVPGHRSARPCCRRRRSDRSTHAARGMSLWTAVLGAAIFAALPRRPPLPVHDRDRAGLRARRRAARAVGLDGRDRHHHRDRRHRQCRCLRSTTTPCGRARAARSERSRPACTPWGSESCRSSGAWRCDSSCVITVLAIKRYPSSTPRGNTGAVFDGAPSALTRRAALRDAVRATPRPLLCGAGHRCWHRRGVGRPPLTFAPAARARSEHPEGCGSARRARGRPSAQRGGSRWRARGPVPTARVSRYRSRSRLRVNASARSSSESPGPVSSTATPAVPEPRTAASVTVPPAGVALSGVLDQTVEHLPDTAGVRFGLDGRVEALEPGS